MRGSEVIADWDAKSHMQTSIEVTDAWNSLQEILIPGCRVGEMAQWIKPLMLNCEGWGLDPQNPCKAICICNSSMLTGKIGGRDRSLPRGSGSASLVCSGESQRDRVSNKVGGED